MSKILYLPELKEARKNLRKNATSAEDYLWYFLRRKRLGYKFCRQVSIGYFVVDFYCKELSLAIELDGSIHNKKNVKERDHLRQAILESDNVKIFRFKNEEVFDDTEVVLLKIQTACSKLAG